MIVGLKSEGWPQGTVTQIRYRHNADDGDQAGVKQDRHRPIQGLAWAIVVPDKRPTITHNGKNLTIISKHP